MSVLIKESDLPQELTTEAAVEAAYAFELAETASKLQRGLPTLIECDKDLAPYLYQNVRNRLKARQPAIALPRRPAAPGGAAAGRHADRHDRHDDRPAPRGRARGRRTPRRRAAAPRFAHHQPGRPHRRGARGHSAPLREPGAGLARIQGPVVPAAQGDREPVPASRSACSASPATGCATSSRARKAASSAASSTRGRSTSTSPAINAVRLRRLLSTLEGEDYPADPGRAYRQLRQATLGGALEVPTVSLDRDIGGYAKVKERLRSDILDVLARKEQLTNEEQIRAMEELIPKGMIFWGPPGTGKTLFAKAIASEIGAAVTVVSGPELKSKWVGESRGEPSADLPPGPAVGAVDHRVRRAGFVRLGPRHLHRQRRRAFDGQPAADRDGRLPPRGNGLRGRHDELRRDPRPGAAAARPVRVPPAHPVSRRRGPPRDPRASTIGKWA